jgi:alkylated DNA repair dioxygenase AlkB
VQSDLFDVAMPEGFEYRAGFVTRDEQLALVDLIGRLPFEAVRMHGGVARRRTVHYGWTYGYESRRSEPGAPIPEFLLPLRARVAAWMGVTPEELAEGLITEYPLGAPIGWHRDAPMFEDIAGVSLGSECRIKFRPYMSPDALSGPQGARPLRRTTHQTVLEPRSAYLIRGSARRDFEHSIPPVEGTRYSATFRTMQSRERPSSSA